MKNLKVSVFTLLFLCVLAISCKEKKEEKPQETVEETTVTQVEETAPKTFTTLLGKTYKAPAGTPENMKLYDTAKANYDKDPSLENLIWLGRRTAYINKYQEAIDLYTKGLEEFPDNPKLLRHRGHRYISVRQHDKAIVDLEKAAKLVEGMEDEAEEGGNPNAVNKFYGSLKTGIFYHLGVAYYLKQDFQKAYDAFNTCRNVRDNLENFISCSNWMYMSQRRLGNKAKADAVLKDVKEGMDIVENEKYYELCKMYKGLPVPEDMVNGLQMHQDAIMYGMTNKDIYNNNMDAAKEKLEKILEADPQVSFGYMAAESDYKHLFADKDKS